MANPNPLPTPASNTSELSARLEGKDPDPVIYEGDIDQRMAALLADHIDMGARPADDVTVAENREAGNRASDREAKTTDGRNVMPKSTTTGRKKAAAKKSK